MILDKNDTIVAVVAKACHGPGWSNTPIWVFVQNGDGRIRQECLQPEEQSPDMRLLYEVLDVTHSKMLHAVNKIVKSHEKSPH